ncbi:MAG: hypothetical protein AAB733_03940 [Patescibacteria group bacterium]
MTEEVLIFALGIGIPVLADDVVNIALWKKVQQTAHVPDAARWAIPAIFALSFGISLLLVDVAVSVFRLLGLGVRSSFLLISGFLLVNLLLRIGIAQWWRLKISLSFFACSLSIVILIALGLLLSL